MIVLNKKDKQKLEVYCVYWIDGERYYYVILPGHDSLFAMRECECDILDLSINEKFYLRKNDYGGDMLVHKALYEDNLLDELIDSNPEAMKEFKRRINYAEKEKEEKRRQEGEAFCKEIEDDIRKKEEYLLCNYGITLDELKSINAKMGL